MNANKEIYSKNKKHLTRIGGEWGGFHLDMNLVTEKSTVISCGIGPDMSADKVLIDEKKCYIIGVDPTRTALKTKLLYTSKNFKKRKT